MKRTTFFLLMLLAFQVSQAQFKFGIRGGLNFANLPQETYQIDIMPPAEISTLSESFTGFHVGVMSQISLLGLFIMPEVLFVSSGNDLVLKQEGAESDTYFQHRFSQLDIPIMVGTKLGPVRAGLGPVATFILNSDSNLPEENFQQEIEEKFNAATYGFQLGAGVNLGNLALDLKYQFGLSSLGDGITIGGQSFDFDTRPRQIVFSIGLMF